MTPTPQNSVKRPSTRLSLNAVKAFTLCLPTAALMACSGGDSSSPISVTATPSPQNSVSPTQVASKSMTAVEMGAKVYKKCRTCHTLNEDGRNKVGPNLWDIYGMTAGQKDDFAYSKAMKESGLVWNETTMDGYLENPAKYMPGNRMSFIGLRKKEDRDNLQAFMRAETTPSE